MPYFQIPSHQVLVMKNSLMRLTITQGQPLHRVLVPDKFFPPSEVGVTDAVFSRRKSYWLERKRWRIRQRAVAWIARQRGLTQ